MNAPAPTYAHLDCYRRAGQETRNRRAELYAMSRRYKKALQLYFRDLAAARKGEGAYPSVDAFTAKVGLDYDASEYAISRFGELSKRKA